MGDVQDYPTEVNRWEVFEVALQGRPAAILLLSRGCRASLPGRMKVLLLKDSMMETASIRSALCLHFSAATVSS